MMIWLGKNWLGQTDKVALSGQEGRAVAVEVVDCRPGEMTAGGRPRILRRPPNLKTIIRHQLKK